MDADIQIRYAYAEDIEAMTELLSELFAIEDDFLIDPAKQKQGLELLLQKPDAKVLIATDSNRIIGMVSMQCLISTAGGARVGLIEDMIITFEYRGMGIGSLLLDSMIEEAGELGYARLSLAVDRRNDAALDFYKRFEFKSSNMGLLYRNL
ncbi:GNAT family N-acetyltransferase [Sulfuricurvum sp.]|uniref:GNAT family N-acetyltransferase n=1 Tax=Sulfuricurvum sp. TaxID=2025608 RepID=UPI00262EA06A|nr:GNAT family N-acetyltransferase [Sulfuricurvum sp.]MDD2266909.1 GNAT family N-acetyltransferase [Sulfuricurvum sp.]MDD2784781.1 GNAT family N-acetyltransferase [Sulfuricurvum sp.]